MVRGLKLQKTCPNCKKKIKMSLKFCNFCGSDLGQHEINCPNCGKSIKMNLNICNHCGTDIIQYKIDKFEESQKGFKLHELMRILAGLIFIFSALFHLLFVLGDFPVGILYYWVLGDPNEVKGLEALVLIAISFVIALILGVIHALFYLVNAGLLIFLRRNKVAPYFSTVMTIIGLALALRVILIFGYTSLALTYIMIIDSIVLGLSIYIIVVS